MSIGLFIWTFDGVIRATVLGVFLIAVVACGLLLGVARIMGWWKQR